MKSPEDIKEDWPVTEELDTGAETLAFPVFKESDAQRIRRPGDAVLINAPPGCFGNGPGPLKTRAKTLALNTASLITYGRLYEILLVLSKTDKDGRTRKNIAAVELELGALPAPIAEIKCTSQELCFPKFGGVFVNPTSRLAIRGNCLEQCKGTEIYHWELFQDSVPAGCIAGTLGCLDQLNTVSLRISFSV